MLSRRGAGPLGLLLGLFVGGGGCSKPPAVQTDAQVHARGAQLFGALCARCHGSNGGGGEAAVGGVRPRNFRDATFHAMRTDEQLAQTVLKGKGGQMPSFDGLVGPEDLRALVTHLRTFDPGQHASR